MGRDMCSLQVVASVSRHNSEQDRLDDARWDELVTRIEALVAEYGDIGAVV